MTLIVLLVAGAVGIFFSIIHAVATINLRANHIVSGTVINMLAPALAVFLTKVLYEGAVCSMTNSLHRPKFRKDKFSCFEGYPDHRADIFHEHISSSVCSNRNSACLLLHHLQDDFRFAPAFSR